MYSFKKTDKRWYVIHDETGCTLPYHSKLRRYREEGIPSYKKEYFIEWLELSNSQRKRMKERAMIPKTMTVAEVQKLNEHVLSCFNMFNREYDKVNMCYVDDCPMAPSKKKLGEDEMYVSQDVTVREKNEITAQREHFLTRVSTIYSQKDAEERIHFGLDAPRGPTTARELVQWVKDGKFTFVQDDEDESFNDDVERYNVLAYIKWTKTKKDVKGYEAAMDKLTIMYHQTRDAIWAESDFTKAPSLLEAFEKKSFH